jgi:hypothetical protein
MMRSLAAALLGGVLLLAGCGKVETQPPSDRTTVTQPPEPAAAPGDPRLGNGRSATPGSMPDETGTPQTQRKESDAAVADPAGTTPDLESQGISAEIIGRTEGTAAPAPASADANLPEQGRALKPNDGRRAEPNDVRPAEPNVPVSIPDRQKDAAARPDEDGAGTIFEEYGEILNAYVREDGWVDYGALHRRRLDLKRLLMKLGDLDPNTYRRWSRDDKLAFWINAYNLKMLDIITRNYPIQSSWWLRLTWPPDDIRHIRGIWTDFKLLVMDEEFTLGEVERRLFQKTFGDPRVYLALTYASRSSPFLRRRPYQGPDLDRQLDEQVRQFLASPQGFQIDRHGMVVRLSALFKPTWRGAEFVDRYGTDKKFKTCDPETRAVLNFLTAYLPREDVYFLEVENYTIEYMNFDWRLNDTSRGY